MQVEFKILYLKKRFPLRISRGIREGSYNLFVAITDGNHTGWGEMSPGKNEGLETPEEAQEQLAQFLGLKPSLDSIFDTYDLALAHNVAPCALAALDIALWDLKAKKAQMPLYQMFGFSKPKVLTSNTLGIMSAEEARERIPFLIEKQGFKVLKVKLGNPEGIEADKQMYAQVYEYKKKHNIKIRIDANGGWSLDDAKHMMDWLATRHCDYIEQPLKEGMEDQLPELFKNRKLPIFVDESCRLPTDIPKWAHAVDGVNMKLMKSGGITGALRIIATAKAFGLKTMIGCMGESSISIAAAASVSGMLDHIDLDSHLNLAPDPSEGAPLINGIITPLNTPGHGASLKPEFKTA